MTDKFPLTVEQAAKFHRDGVVEIRERIEPPPEEIGCDDIKRYDNGKYYYISFSQCNEYAAPETRWISEVKLPHGPDRRVWIAEPWVYAEWDEWEDEAKAYRNCSARLTLHEAEETGFLDEFDEDQYQKNPPETMPRAASRADAQLTTRAEQVEGVWELVVTLTKIEAMEENNG